MVFPARIPSTRRAHQATEYARAHGKHQKFHSVVFRLHHAQGHYTSRWEVLLSAAQETGPDPDEMQREMEEGHYTHAVAEQIAVAQARGISGVPTYILDDKYAIVGAQPYEAFQRVLVRVDGEASQSRAES